jgi:serine/threonine protein kinase
LTGHFGYLYSWYAFKAPEVDSDFVHDKSVDLWSLGAIMYMLLTGLPPFRQTGIELVQAKHAGIVEFDGFSSVPTGTAQRLVKGLLQVQPEYRFTIDDVLNHEWMIQDDELLEHHDLSLALDYLKDWRRTS